MSKPIKILRQAYDGGVVQVKVGTQEPQKVYGEAKIVATDSWEEDIRNATRIAGRRARKAVAMEVCVSR